MDELYREDLKRVLYGVDDGLNRYGGGAGFVEHAMDNLSLQTATKKGSIRKSPNASLFCF